VPRSILLPYAGIDVDAPRYIAEEQVAELDPFMSPRGVNGEWPSLWQTVLDTQRNIYELERVGLGVDRERLVELRRKYQAKLAEVSSVLVAMAAKNGIENFNFKSTPQVRKLLFDSDYLDLTPIKTTDNKPWDDSMRGLGGLNQEAHDLVTPSTDKNTLDILQDAHPVVKILNQARKLDMVNKTWLRLDTTADPSTSGGGIESKIWPDGRLHTHFSQLSDTGRFRHSKPNSANWPKKAEGYMAEIFGGKEHVPPGLRTIIVPAPGYVLMEGDFVQAELFVLAALSGDPNMWEALTTPGKDMHDMTAITSFKLKVVDPDGLEVPEDNLLDLAATDKARFEEVQSHLCYLDTKGRTLTRKEFKDGIRVSAKNLNFGIPYGRGSLDIARQVRGETGTDQSLDSLKLEIDQMMSTWKEETYARAWRYMEECAEAVENPGYLKNPWGRMRRFKPSSKRDVVDSMKREAQNYPIQSTVADTCMLAMQRMVEYREEHNLHFRLVNQIHDAIMVEVPENEIEKTKAMFQDTMGSIDIPIKGREPLRLGVDVEVLTRWGEKVKQ
jgi:DNA polymerase-1